MPQGSTVYMARPELFSFLLDATRGNVGDALETVGENAGHTKRGDLSV